MGEALAPQAALNVLAGTHGVSEQAALNAMVEVAPDGLGQALSDKADLVDGAVPLEQLPTNAANTVRPTSGSPAVLTPDQAGDLAYDAAPSGGGITIYAPMAGGVWPAGIQLAPKASPTFTGTPAAPTAAFGDNSTTIATTAYVQASGFTTPGSWLPSDDGYLAWAFDYSLAASNFTVTAGTEYVVALWLRANATISSISFVFNVNLLVGTGTYFTLRNSAGTRVGQSGDLSAALSGKTGVQSGTLATPYVATAGLYYATFLGNGFGTVPQLGRNSAVTAVNGPRTGVTSRYGTGNTGVTGALTPPGSSCTVAALSDALWAAMS